MLTFLMSRGNIVSFVPVIHVLTSSGRTATTVSAQGQTTGVIKLIFERELLEHFPGAATFHDIAFQIFCTFQNCEMASEPTSIPLALHRVHTFILQRC